MCCSRVCSAKRNAGFPALSILCPTNLPGRDRSKPSRTARKPACGPPNPIGTPNLCAEPIAISAPHSPGDLIRVRANKSVAMITNVFFALASLIRSMSSGKAPNVSGYCTRRAKTSRLSRASLELLISNSAISIPSGFARVSTTALVCG